MADLIDNTIKAEWTNADALDLQPTCNQLATDSISRQAAIDAVKCGALSAAMVYGRTDEGSTALYETVKAIKALPSAQPEEVIPHRNYKYLSDYWCECGWHLGKKGEVKYCADCGRKVNWDG